MRNDLLTILSRHNDLTNVIVLTFNIDLIFLETVLLRTLRRCGHPSLTVFADAEEVSRTFDSQAPWLASIGRRFRVVPVTMSQGYRFHPKVVLLSGPKKGELLVGSGNLTYGGFRQNDEVWTSFVTDGDGTAAFSAFREMLDACLERCPDARRPRQEVNEAFDVATRSWASEMESPGGMIWRIGDGPALLEQMRATAGDMDVERIVVCAPYFDDRGAALRAIASTWPRAQIEILVQPGQSHLTQSVVDGSKVQVRLRTIGSRRVGDSPLFIHGKFYALSSKDEVLLFTGSANCSATALTATGGGGNAESLAVLRMTATEFQHNILAELNVDDSLPTLPQHRQEDPEAQGLPSIMITGASFEAGIIQVSFKAPDDIRIDMCRTHDSSMTIAQSDVSGTVVKLPLAMPPRWVRLEGVHGDRRVASRRHWVDLEFALSATSRQRKLAQSIEGGISPASWSFGSWVEIMRLLGDHLKHEPGTAPPPSRKPGDDAQRQVHRYDPEEFFTDDYRLPSRRVLPLFEREDERVLGLQRLLLEYFGFESETIPDEDDDASNGSVAEDEAVDRPEKAPRSEGKRKGARKKRDLGDAERRRARKVAKRVVDRILDEHFVLQRFPDVLGNDLTILAVLLLAGYAENWLPSDDFFELTYSAWTRLFLDSGHVDPKLAPPRGLISMRLEVADDPDAFRMAVASVSLSSALALWSFACPTSASRAERARFALASRLAVAQLPWLWNFGKADDVAKEMERIAARTGWLDEGGEERWHGVSEHWNTLLAEGRALCRLEAALATRSIVDWGKLIDAKRVRQGELLWQGALGFGIATDDVNRQASDTNARVLFLRTANLERTIRGTYLLPVRNLLRELVGKGTVFRSQDEKHLRPFLKQLGGFGVIRGTPT